MGIVITSLIQTSAGNRTNVYARIRSFDVDFATGESLVRLEMFKSKASKDAKEPSIYPIQIPDRINLVLNENDRGKANTRTCLYNLIPDYLLKNYSIKSERQDDI